MMLFLASNITFSTVGLFCRVPGDIDAVNTLKVALDKFEVSDNYSEPHVPGSALKLWFRELQEVRLPCLVLSSSFLPCLAKLVV